MSNARANLLSLDALTDLDRAISVYRGYGVECVEEVRRHVRQLEELLESRKESAERQVRVCEENLRMSDDEDRDYYEEKLEEAIQRVRLIRRWRSKAEDESRRYFSESEKFSRLITEKTRKSQIELREKFQQGSDYLSFQLDGEITQTQTPKAVPETQQVHKNAQPFGTPKIDEMSELSLPPGFRWVSLEHIDRLDDLRDDEGFGKGVSEEDMRRGFGTLRRKILPYIQQHPDASSQTFLGLDGYTDEGRIKSRQAVFEAFFHENNAITLERKPDTEGLFGVQNGRHRIKVARDLGWNAVPVRVLGE